MIDLANHKQMAIIKSTWGRNVIGYKLCSCISCTDPIVLGQVISILASSTELMNLIKNVDTVFHLKSTRSSKSLLNRLYRFIPTIREELQVFFHILCCSF